jgi:HEPN domain-containing protein
MQPSHLASAEEWFIRAERDLIHAEQSLTNAIVINEAIVYHTQQAAEKALKGYLTARGQTFPKIHDVAQLVTTAATIDQRFAAYFNHAQALAPYATDFRYPGGDLEPGDQATQDALRMARDLIEFVRKRLADLQTPPTRATP